MGRLQRLRRALVVTLKAIIACHCQRAAPTLTTVLEIAALTAPLIKPSHGGADNSPTLLSPSDAPGSDSLEAGHTAGAAAAATGRARPTTHTSRHHKPHTPNVLHPPVRLAQALLGATLRLAHGCAPAVVLAQGVRLVGSLVAKREQPPEEGKQEGTEVRALQLGLTHVPRVDPRVPRTLQQYCAIYREWLLLLRGRLAQSGLELPEGLFDPGQEGDEELMRFALCYNLLQARSLKDALVAMDRTAANIREYSIWHRKYNFIAAADLEAWQRIAWWEGPDSDGHLWLMIDYRAAVEASRAHGPELVSRVLVSNVECGVRQLIPDLGCAGTLRVVVDASGVHIGAALRTRGVFQRLGHVIDRMYPCRLHVLYIVGLPFPLRWTTRAAIHLLHAHTRRKMRLCRATDVPRRLPSQLRSHKLSVAAGLDNWAFLDASYRKEGPGAGAPGSAVDDADADSIAAAPPPAGSSVVGSEYGSEPFSPHTPAQQQQRAKGAGGMRFRWRRGGRMAGGEHGGPGAGSTGSSHALAASRRRLRVRLLKGGLLVLAAALLLLLAYLFALQQLVPELGNVAARRLLRLLRRAVGRAQQALPPELVLPDLVGADEGSSEPQLV